MARAQDIAADPLYVKLAAEVNAAAITASNFTSVVLKAMQFIETGSNLKGVQKKDWVLSALRQLVVSNRFLTEDARAKLLTDIDVTIPAIIDSLIDVANGVYVLTTEVAGCCSAICSKK